MSRRRELTGQRFGRWTVIQYSHTSKRGRAFWECKCDCGAVKEVLSSDLTSGKSQSCKCLNYEVSTTHGMTNSRIYQTWTNMKSRCDSPSHASYEYYGARGITYDPRWIGFEAFYADMSDTYQDDLTLERKDVNGHYCKENCEWATMVEQANNKRETQYFTVEGVTDTFANLCRKYGIGYDVARGRLRSGRNINQVFEVGGLV